MEEKYNIDWYSIIDILAREYGWTIEKIQSLTIPEIKKLIDVINKRKIIEWNILCYVINCAFAGKKPKLENKDEVKVDDPNALINLMKAIGGKVEKV